MSPLISCIIPTYNRAHLLRDAITGTINQSYKNWELIIVDDRSEDQTAEVVKALQSDDSRIKYVRNAGKGGNAARNMGIQLAKGEYIAFLDDDDFSLPHRFDAQLNAMIKSGSKFLVSGYQVRDRITNQILSEHKLDLRVKAAGFPSRWMVRKELLESVGGFDEQFSAMQEIDLSYRLSALETYSLHDDIVTVIYQTPGSVSRDQNRRIKGRLQVLKKHEKDMHPVEAAWWYFITGVEFFAKKDGENAEKMFKKAASLDDRKIYLLAFRYYQTSSLLFPFFHKVNLRIMNFFSGFRIPTIVDHPVVL